MIEDLILKRTATPQEVFDCFDALPVIDVTFMYGRWKGFEISTGHLLDGLLEPSGWYGKLFESKESVHPLLFYGPNKKSLYAVNPAMVPLTAPFPRSPALGTMMAIAKPFLQTRSSKARLRMIEFRGRSTATMAYDHKPIFDHFVKIDDRRVLGIMDLKGVPGPYAFCLERDNNPIEVRL
jgi:hypothetical protein